MPTESEPRPADPRSSSTSSWNDFEATPARDTVDWGNRRPGALFAALLITAAFSVGAWLLLDNAGDGAEPFSVAVTPDGPAENLTPVQIAGHYGDAVYRVETEGCGLTGVGSGFAVSEDILITNWHVVANDTTPTLHSRDGDTLEGEVIGWVEDPDIAVVKLTEPADTFVRWAYAYDVTEGDSITALGYPVPTHEFSVIAGSVLSFVTEGSRRTGLRTDANVDHGSSGGPAFTDSGLVAGVVTRRELSSNGFDYTPVVTTYDELETSIASMLGSSDGPDADCQHPFLLAHLGLPTAETPQKDISYFETSPKLWP